MKAKIKAVSMLVRKTQRGIIFLGMRLIDINGKCIVDKMWDEDAIGEWVTRQLYEGHEIAGVRCETTQKDELQKITFY